MDRKVIFLLSIILLIYFLVLFVVMTINSDDELYVREVTTEPLPKTTDTPLKSCSEISFIYDKEIDSKNKDW